MEGWEELRRTRYERQLGMGLLNPETRLPDHVPDLPSWADEEHKEWQDLRMAIYAGMIDCMDQGIGRILQALRGLRRRSKYDCSLSVRQRRRRVREGGSR